MRQELEVLQPKLVEAAKNVEAVLKTVEAESLIVADAEKVDLLHKQGFRPHLIIMFFKILR